MTEEETGRPSVFIWGSHVGETQVMHGVQFRLPQTSEDAADFQPVLLRILCHVLVDQVSDRGLQDVCEALGESVEFYLPPVETIHRLPEPESEFKLRLGPSQVRPEFVIDDEE